MAKPDIYTSYKLCKDADACSEELRDGIRKFGGVRKHGANTKTHLSKILPKIGLDDTLWILDRAVEGKDAHRILHQFRADCAIRVLKHFERQRPDDSRPRNAISSTRRHAVGRETAAARDAARDAAGAAAWTAARDAARDAARTAAWAAAWAANTAKRPAAEGDWQATRLAEYLMGTEKPLRMPPKP